MNSALEAAKGKKKKSEIAKFIFNLENEIIDLKQELCLKEYTPLPYTTFMVYDPKQRLICAAPFRDRVVHHAVCKAIEPIFERSLIFDTYACRKFKGSHKSVSRAQKFCRKYDYYIKFDIRKFFDTIDHNILKIMIRRKIKDNDTLWLIDLFIDNPVPWTDDRKGIPIGNLTSQHFANFYLSGLDHFIKEYLNIGGYIRYMDDFVLFADEKSTLWDAAKRIDGYIKSKLKLQFKSEAVLLSPVCNGLRFLGFMIFPNVVRLIHPNVNRFKRKVKMCNDKMLNGSIEYEEWSRIMACLIGFVKHANTLNLRKDVFKGQRYKNE